MHGGSGAAEGIQDLWFVAKTCVCPSVIRSPPFWCRKGVTYLAFCIARPPPLRPSRGESAVAADAPASAAAPPPPPQIPLIPGPPSPAGHVYTFSVVETQGLLPHTVWPRGLAGPRWGRGRGGGVRRGASPRPPPAPLGHAHALQPNKSTFCKAAPAPRPSGQIWGRKFWEVLRCCVPSLRRMFVRR